jgi:hypothetical protein
MIIGIAGAAGSGKDTVAGFIAKYSNAVSIAQADPMKRFARDVFDFSEEQLWGPSECRNAADERYRFHDTWAKAEHLLLNRGEEWIKEVLPGSEFSHMMAMDALRDWFKKLFQQHQVENRILTPRYMLQTIGTEWGRQFSADIWNQVALRTARKLLAGGVSYHRAFGLNAPNNVPTQRENPEFVLVTDVRFRNELLGIIEAGGTTISVESPSENNAAVEAAGVKGHKSEAELKGVPRHWFGAIILNDKSKGLQALENTVHGFVNELKMDPVTFSTEFSDSLFDTHEAHN